MTDEHPPWLRGDAQLVDVSFPGRVIEMIVMPYDKTATVEYEGRRVTEVIDRAAFDGIQRRPNRIKANRNHDWDQVFGRATALHPDRDEGLHAEVHVSQTPLGDETLTLAADGCLDVSAGFRPMHNGIQWQGRDGYRVTKAWLDHISLVPQGAYGEDARVIAVRAALFPVVLTPNLDAARALIVEAASLRAA